MSDLTTAPLKEAEEANLAPPAFSDNPVCSGDGKTCGECGKVFSHPFYFSTHISIHASEKGHSMAGQCVHCGLTFSDATIFQKHLVSSQAKVKAENETEKEEEMATAACIEYDNAEQDNEREKETERKRSRNQPDVKPALSREFVTVKQEIQDPPDVSPEPKAKRRRTSIQRYEPQTHADPDNDPAVEAYLMSLKQMGLTVDPAAFGHPSSISRGGRRGAQGRGRSRGHGQTFGRGSALMLPREIYTPKKPSPKYEYMDYDNVLEDEGEVLPKSGKQTRGERLQQRLQRLSQQKEPEKQPTTAISESVQESKSQPKNETKSETKDKPKVVPDSSPSPKPKIKAEKVSKPGTSGLSSYKTPRLNRGFALDKNMIKAELEDRDYTPNRRQQGRGKRGTRGSRGHQRGGFLHAMRPPPAPLQPPPPAPSIPGLTGYARANPNFRPPIVQTLARPPPPPKAIKHGAIASQLKIKMPNFQNARSSNFVSMTPQKSTERMSKTMKTGPAKEAFPKLLKVTSPKGIEGSKQESRDYVEIMLQTLSDELIPNKLSKTFPTSTTFFGNTVDALTGTSVRMPQSRAAFPGTIVRSSRMSAPVRGSMFIDPFGGHVRQAGFPDYSTVANLNFNYGTRFPGPAPVRAPRSRGRAGASGRGRGRGRGQMISIIDRSGPLAQSLAYPVKIGRGVGRGEKNATRPPVQKLVQKPVICTDEVIVLEDDDDEGDSSTNKVKPGADQKSIQPEKHTAVIIDIDKADSLKSKTEVIQALTEKTSDNTDLTPEHDKKLNMPASVRLKRIKTSSLGSKADPEEDKIGELKNEASNKKEGDEMEVEDIEGWKVCLAANSDSESETEKGPNGSKKDLNGEASKEENPKPDPELPCPDQDEKTDQESDKNEKDTNTIKDEKTSDIKDASNDSEKTSNITDASNDSEMTSNIKDASNDSEMTSVIKNASDDSGETSDIKDASNDSDKTSDIKDASDDPGKTSDIKDASDCSAKTSHIKDASDDSGKTSDIKDVSDDSAKTSHLKDASNDSAKTSDGSGKTSDIKDGSDESGKTSDIKDASDDSVSRSVTSSSSAVPLTFPPFIKDTDNLLDIFSEIEKTCKEIEENSGNEKEDSGTESESRESRSDTKTRTVAANSPQEISKMGDGKIGEGPSGDCKIGNLLEMLDGDKDKSSQDLDKTNSPQHDSLSKTNSPQHDSLSDKALSTEEQEDSAKALVLDHDEKNHEESDSCKAKMNEREPDNKGDDKKVAGKDDRGGTNPENVATNDGEMDAMISFPDPLDLLHSNFEIERSSLAEQHMQMCREDEKRQEVTNSKCCTEPNAGNMTSANQSCPDSTALRDDRNVAGFEAMETDDGNVKEATAADTVEMDSADPSETLTEAHMNTEAGQGELKACGRLNVPSSEMNENNENLTDMEDDINKSLLNSIPFSASDKNNALVKSADSKNVSGNGPGYDSINQQNCSKAEVISPDDEIDKKLDFKVTSPDNTPFETQQESVKNIPSETVSESTALSQTLTTDDSTPCVSENCVAQQDGASENENMSEETFKKRSPGRTSCKDNELSPNHFDEEDDADRDGSDFHRSGSNSSGSSRLNGVGCMVNGEKDGTAASAGGGNDQSVNVSECDSLSTCGPGSALVENLSMRHTKIHIGKSSFINAYCKRWERGASRVRTKNATAITSLCICPGQSKSLKMPPNLLKQVSRLQKSGVRIRSHKSGKKICNRPPRVLSKRSSTYQSFNLRSQRPNSCPWPGTRCTSGEGHSLTEHTVMYNDVFSDLQIKSFIYGSQCDAKDDIMGIKCHYSYPHHKQEVMCLRQAECCPFSFESFNLKTLQHTGSHCVKENSFTKRYSFSKILPCPQNVLPKMQKSYKLTNLKSCALARKLRLNKGPYHHISLHKGSQSGSRSRGRNKQQKDSGRSGASNTGRSGRSRANSSRGLTGNGSGGNGDHEDDENRERRGGRSDLVKEENQLKCSVCGVRFEVLKELQKHMLKQHEGDSKRPQQDCTVSACNKKPQRFWAERADSFSKSIESSHVNSNTYENLTVGQTQVVLVKPNNPVVSFSLPNKKTAKRPAHALPERSKQTGRDSKKNDAKMSKVGDNLSDIGSSKDRQVSRKLHKKHLTVKIPRLAKGITESKSTGMFRVSKSQQQCVGSQEPVDRPTKSFVNSLPLHTSDRAIKAETPPPDVPASNSISVRAEPKLLASVAVNTEPCSDHSCSPSIKEEILSDGEDDSLPVTFGDSCLFKREPSDTSISKPTVDSSSQQTTSTCCDSNTICTPKRDNHYSSTDGRTVKGDLHSNSLNLRPSKNSTQKEQDTKTEIVFVYPNKPVINAFSRSHSQMPCPDIMLDRCEPHKDVRNRGDNTDSSSVHHGSSKKPTQKVQETKVVYVYPKKPVINASTRNHSDITHSSTRKEAVRLPSSRCSKQDDLKQVLHQGANIALSTSAPKAKGRGKQTPKNKHYFLFERIQQRARPREQATDQHCHFGVRPPKATCGQCLGQGI